MCTVCGSGAEAAHWTDYPLADRGPLSATGTRLRRAEALTRLVGADRARVTVSAGHYVVATSTGRRVVARHLGELWAALPATLWAAVHAGTPEPTLGTEVDWAAFGVALSAYVHAHRREYAEARCTVTVAGGPTVRILATPTGTGRLDVVAAAAPAFELTAARG